MNLPVSPPKLIRGVVHGRTISLDEDVALDGVRVVVLVAPNASELVFTPEENRALLQEWARSGHDGPISDEDAGA